MTKDGRSKHARCAAIDVGASSGRVILAELAGGRIRLTETHRFETPLIRAEVSGYDHWDIDAIIAHVRQGIEKAEATAPLDSVGCDTWGVDYVLLDAQGDRIGPAIAYRDRRTEGVMDEVFAQMPPEEIYRRTGIHFQAYNTLYQLAATRIHEPCWLTRARRLLFTPDYLHFRLCGVMANEYTIASTSQLLNVETRQWEPELLAIAGLDRGAVTPPVDPGTVLGDMTLSNGRTVKVIAPGSHDTASAVAAAPLMGPDEMFISSGTWSLIGIENGQPYTGPDARRFNLGNEGGVARRYRVLKNVMGMWLIQCVRKELGSPDFSELVAAAAASPGWTTLIDPDDQRFFNPASMIGAIREFAAEHDEPIPLEAGPLARCIFDSLALKCRQVKEELETVSGKPLSGIRIIGGGSRNGLLNQLIADACALPVSAGPVETSALGNACVQMMALGAIGSLEEARAIVRRSSDIANIAPSQPVPDLIWQRYRALCR